MRDTPPPAPPAETWRARLAWPTALALAAAGCAAALAQTLGGVVALHSPVPFHDQWNALSNAELLGGLFTQHNEHRLVFPRVFFLLDNLIVGGRQHVNVAASLALQLAHGAILWGAARAAGLQGRAALGVAALATLAIMLAPYQLEVFTWGFQVQFPLTFAAAAGAYALMARPGEGPVATGGAIALAGVSAFSLASGVFTPVLLTLQAALLGKSVRTIVAVGASAVVFFALYLFDFRLVGSHPDPFAAWARPDRLAAYVLMYVGAPLGWAGGDLIGDIKARDEIANVAMVASLIVSALVGLRWLGRRHTAQGRAESVLAFSMLTVLVAAGVTALGRVEFGVSQGMSIRYASAAVVYWAAFALVVLVAAQRGGGKTRVAAVIAVLAMVGLHALGAQRVRDTVLSTALARDAVETAFLAGVVDPDAFAGVYPNPAYVARRAGVLEAEALSAFARPVARLRGARLGEAADLEQIPLCPGAIDARAPIPGAPEGGRRLAGWVEGPVSAIALADAEGRVVGFGRIVRGGAAPARRWSGHAEAAGGALTAYGVRAGRLVCRLSA